MPLALRHRDDPVPALARVDGVAVARITDPAYMAAVQGRTVAEMERRFDDGHRAYVASIGGWAAAFGWVATRTADIGELGSSFTIGDGERYLWNFVTFAEFRGRGIYPMLIEEILRREGAEAERFWIAYAPENHASGAGIRKAGFRAVAELSFDADGRPAVRALAGGGGAAAARFLGIPEAATSLAQCWKCVRAGRTGHYCAPGECRCDYQRPEVACHG